MQEQHELLLERARLHAGQHENGSYEQYGHSNGHSHAGPSGEDAEEDPILLHVLEAASRWEAVALAGKCRTTRRLARCSSSMGNTTSPFQRASHAAYGPSRPHSVSERT